MKTLKHVDDSAMCIARRKSGRGYSYFDEDGSLIKDKKLLRRIRKLVIPPMWTDVQVCQFDDGHIQATGRDLKGRKQYIYHEDWEKKRQEEKFNKLIQFGELLPSLRQRCLDHIERKKWDQEKVLSLIVLILDECGIRIGNQYYQKKNQTYGLTTLRRKHLDIDDGLAIFQFKGKSNKEREVLIEDPALTKLIRKSADLPGYELFRYKDESGAFKPVDSQDVNEFIHENMGDQFSAKDFRTWTGSRLAVEYYPQAKREFNKSSRKKLSNILIKKVADELGNTPTIARSYYVHPKLLNAVEKATLPEVKDVANALFDPSLNEAEQVLLQVLNDT